MLAKKIALGFGIAVVLPMLVHYGVSTFQPAPKWENYNRYQYYQQDNGNLSQEERAKREQERQQNQEEYRTAEKNFQQKLFFVSVPVGITAIVIGSINPVQAIGTGLMFGGIFTLSDGYVCYWSELGDGQRFLSLLAAFIVLIFIGYKKLSK